ncbi:MAG: type II secretion system F family protein [Acidimicrobiales bacterium]
MVNTAVLILVASLGGGGVCLFIAGLCRKPVDVIAVTGQHRGPTRGQLRQGAIALTAGLLAFAVTRWPVAIPLGAGAVLGLRGLVGGPGDGAIEKLEAIASWTEMLRDTLAGAAGLTQALIATAQVSPRAIREQVGALASRLSAGALVATALRSFADELADPAADVVVATLLMAATERAHRLGDLLGALAESTRQDVAMRQAVEASRASARSAVRTVTGFSLGFVAFMVVFARPYLEPYRTPVGQAMLVVVAAVFGLGLWLMGIMVRARPQSRLLLAGQDA